MTITSHTGEGKIVGVSKLRKINLIFKIFCTLYIKGKHWYWW